MSHTPLRERSVQVDGMRLLRTIEELAEFGGDEQGGVSREAFTPADDAAREYLSRRARDAGLFPHVDQAGNLIVRIGPEPDGRPQLMIGSHLDSVTNGGRLDGAYGVVAALETLTVFAESHVDSRYEPVMVAFTNEEGALFPQPFWGSMAIAGTLTDAESAIDRAGESIREPLARAGGDLDTIDRAAWAPGSIAAYLELHIEQGPVLERRGFPIGVVDAIVGRTIFEITVSGRRNHAGTTPMPDRQDALVASSRLVLAVEEVSKRRKLCSVSTVGLLDVEAGLTNVVPGRCHLSVEIRDTSAEALLKAEEAIVDAVLAIGEETGTAVEVEVTMRSAPVLADPRLMTAIAETADRLELPHMTLSSGAGHDAQIIGGVAPMAMIFVPSEHGISHAPEEHTDDMYLVAGADVLAATAANL